MTGDSDGAATGPDDGLDPEPFDPDLDRRPRQLAVPPARAAELATIAAGGAVGTLARYGIAVVVPSGTVPWPTLAVNLTGAALLGFLVVALAGGGRRRHLIRLGIGTGAIGAYTTMSALAVETADLARHGQVPDATAYLVVSMVAGLVLAWAGGRLARMVVGEQVR